MADEEMVKILNDLGLEDLLECFKKNKITMSVLPKMNETLINSLIPAIGDRAVFLDFWNKNYMKKQPDENHDEKAGRKRKGKHDDDANDSESPSKRVRDKENDTTPINRSVSNNIFTIETMKPLDVLFKESELGRQVLRKYEHKKQLENADRRKICNVIITDILNKNIRLRNDTAEKLANMIVAEFPSEVASVYYVPPILKKENQMKANGKNKSKPSAGKLMSMYRNRRHEVSKLDKLLSTEKENNDNTVNIADESNDGDTIQASVDWLLFNEVPWTLVIEHWKKTSKIRCAEFKKSNDKNVANFFKSWKLYEHVQGYELISIDFEYLKLTKISLNIELWKKFYDILRRNAELNQRDATALGYEEKLSSKHISENSMVVMSLCLIAHLYPSKQNKRINKELFRPSIGLSKESIFKIASTPGDMLLVRDTARLYALQRNITLQPYVIIIGSIEDVQDTYVCIDEKLYKVNGVLHAIDICFKAIFVFNLDYPAASTHLWLLIQKGIYQIDLPIDESISSIEYGLSKLKSEMNETKHVDNQSKELEEEEQDFLTDLSS